MYILIYCIQCIQSPDSMKCTLFKDVKNQTRLVRLLFHFAFCAFISDFIVHAKHIAKICKYDGEEWHTKLF